MLHKGCALHLSKIIAVAVLVLLIAGCTEEKARSLMAAAQLFANKAQAALDAYRDLHLEASTKPQQAEAALLEDTVLRLQGLMEKKQPLNVEAVMSQFYWVDERERRLASIEKELSLHRRLFQDFAHSFRRLPEGSLFAVQAVACAKRIAARLTYDLTVFQENLLRKPVDFRVSRVDLIRQLELALKKTGADSRAAHQDAAQALVDLRRREATQNKEAVS